MKPTPLLLLILDGWGHRLETEANAIAAANTPHWDRLWSQYPHTLLSACGQEVGLEDGQMGNSEVGHLNIGAGRVVHQNSVRISQAIASGELQKNTALLDLFNRIKAKNGRLHLMGLVSDGGIHSLQGHAIALIELAASHDCPTTVHAFLDGRDTPPQSAAPYLSQLMATIDQYPQAEIGSIMGRYYAMDRDQRWGRVQAAYDTLTHHHIPFQADNAADALKQAYSRHETDEFVQPTLISGTHPIQDNDGICFFNFRADRARELTQAFIDPNFSGFKRAKHLKTLHFASMTQYAADLPTTTLFPPQTLPLVLGDVLARQKLKQLRVAETEKYAHVTFFMNGGKEAPFEGEDRILVPSPSVATYDLCPEMNAESVTIALLQAIEEQTHDVIICNYANADMVGHTGDFQATVSAIETLDHCINRVVEALQRSGGECLITADHGNADKMFDTETQQPHTAHTHEKVPLLYIGQNRKFHSEGGLCDIAPTLLYLLGLKQPPEMTGQVLLSC